MIPEAYEQEDGARWTIEGHVEPVVAVLAVVAARMIDVGADEAMEFLVGGPTKHGVRSYLDQRAHIDEILGGVQHIWTREDPKDPDRWVKCTKRARGAEPMTVVAL